MKYLARLRALIAALLDRPLRVKLPSTEGFFYPAEGLVLPVMAGAAPDDDEGGEDDKDDSDGDDSDDDDADDADDSDDDDSDDDADDSDDDKDKDDLGEWKSHARRHEREAKKARRRVKELDDELKKLKDKDKSERQRELEEAVEQAKGEAKSEYEKSLQSSQLEVAVTRLASKGIKQGEGDDAKTVKFADPEDALVHIERALDHEDIDREDIFDSEGKIKNDALTSELADLLDSKPHLAASEKGTDDGKPDKPKGGADGGKGSDSGDKDLESMSPDDHLKRIQKNRN